MYTQVARKLKHYSFIRFLYDAYAFRVFPKSLPVIILSFFMLLSFIILDYFGIWYGFAIIVVSSYVVKETLQDSIIRARNRFHLGVAYGLIISFLWSYFTFVSIHVSVYWSYTLLFITTIIILSLYLSSNTVAEHLAPKINRLYLFIFLDSIFRF